MHWLKLSLPTSQRSSRSSERRGATPRTRRTFSLETLEAKRVLDGTGLLEPPTDDALPLAAAPNTPPATPVVTEPTAAEEGSYEALRIQVNPYFDADGDAHLSTDWEIWTASPLELVWTSYGKTGIDRTHTDLADGVYAGSHAGRTSLFPDTAYVLRVRFHDAQGTVSEWGVQNFQTGSASSIFPLEVRDILAAPAPAWTATVGGAVSLPAGTTPPALEVSTEAGALLLRVQGSASGNVTTNPEILPDFGAVRVRIAAGSAPLALTESDLVFADENGQTITISLPAVSLAAGESLDLWVGLDGSTYYGAAAQTTPEFSLLARGAAVPYVVMQPGYKVEVVAAGFQLPVNIVFVPNPGDLPSDPFYYVIELYGNIKVVSRDGTVSDYVTGLLNFNPTGNFPGSGEQGVAGLVVEPTTGDLIISLLYSTNPADDSAPHYPKLVRLHSADGGRTAATQTTIITFPGETQGQAHQIANLTIDPNDGKLYVHMGDGFDIATALNLDSYRGKILRMNLDGSPATDNPLYDAADGINSRDYIYAYGMRNPFGGAWRASDGQHYFVENGPNLDRFAKLVAGRNYTFDGSDESMYAHAIYNWVPAHAPVNMAFIQPETFGGSLFPASKYDHAFVAESGPTWGLGPQSLGKRIAEFTLDAAGNLVGSPTTLVEYNGSGRGSVVGLAAGPDGLYFSTMYQDQNYQSPIDRGAQILRIKYVGIGNFTSNVQLGTPGVPVKFTDASDVPNATGWLWDFGDGTTSTLQNPTHVYTALGEYSVRLQVTGPNGVATVEKPDFIRVLPNSAGLQAEYFDNMDLTDLKLVRTDAQINYDWGLTAPIPGMGVDTFSVRWSGYILPQFSETYTFHATADDGVRLWVNDQLIIDKWIDQGATEHVGSIALVAGQKSSIKLEYYDNGANAVAQLGWSSPSLAKQIIPASAFSQTNAPPPPTTGTGLNVEYFDNSDLTNSKVARVESQINNDWGLGSPHPAIDVDTFSARWTGYIQAPSTETYTFFTQSDDGVRLWIDDVLIVDNWTNHALTENSGTISLIAGQRYSIRMEYYDNGAFATARLLWQTPAQAKELVPASAFFAALTDVPPPLESGLHAEYFDNADLTNLKVTRVDSVINNNWNAGSPDPSIEPDSFSARWTGFIQAPTTERYTFYTQSDDGIRLWVNGQLLIDNWTNHSALVNRATFDFVAGQRYSFKLEHYDSAGMATAKLAWSSDTQVKQIVPASAFYLEGDGTDPEPPPPPPRHEQ